MNPAHLEPITPSLNSHRKGRYGNGSRQSGLWQGSGVGGINTRKTHCPKGHEYTPENTLNRGGKFPGRICRTCHNEWNRAHPKPRKIYEPRACVVCGEMFTPKRSDRILCGSSRCGHINAEQRHP